MASKSECLALEAMRHFKEAKLATWLGDDEQAARESSKCKRALNYVRNEGLLHELEDLENALANIPDQRTHIGKVRELITKTRADEVTKIERPPEREATEQSVLLTSTLIPLGSNQAEFRARVNISPKKLRSFAIRDRLLNKDLQRRDGRCWQWIEVNKEKGFTALFILTYCDRTAYAQVTTHYFLDHTMFEKTRNVLAQALVDRLLL
jgi:hypothetical protein